jgi:hypothetical protein
MLRQCLATHRLEETYKQICTNVLKAGISVQRGSVGEPGVNSLAGTFKRESNSISGFLLEPENITFFFLSLGAIGTSVKGQGSLDLYQIMGHKRHVYKA